MLFEGKLSVMELLAVSMGSIDPVLVSSGVSVKCWPVNLGIIKNLTGPAYCKDRASKYTMGPDIDDLLYDINYKNLVLFSSAHERLNTDGVQLIPITYST